MRTPWGIFCRVAPMVSILMFGQLSTAHAAISNASVRDERVRAAQLCTKHFPRNERLHGIPSQLLAAIAATESGRWHKGLGLALPWPWTINAEGKGYYLESKSAAIRKARALQQQGIKSMDVGCMQVNLKHHPDAFANLEQAFDPQRNVAYAAKFLRQNYDDARSWTTAASYYHSKTPKYGRKYLAHVRKNWNRILGKVREARSNRNADRKPYVIEVSDRSRAQKFAALNQKHLTMSLNGQAKQEASSAKAVLSPKAAQKQWKGMALRDVDRLSHRSLSSHAHRKISKRNQQVKVIEVTDAPTKPNRQPILLRSKQAATTAEATTQSETPPIPSSREEARLQAIAMAAQANRLVTQHGSSASLAPAKAVTTPRDSVKTSEQPPHFVFAE